MKNNSTSNQSLGRNAMAKRLKFKWPSRMNALVKAGCPQLPSGDFDPAAVEKWIEERARRRERSTDLRQRKLTAEITRIERDIRQRDLEIAKAEGLVHDKALCCASHAAAYAVTLNPLLSLGGRIAAQFPEAGSRLRKSIDVAIDDAFNAIRVFLKDEPPLFCPHCHERVEKLDVEPPDATPALHNAERSTPKTKEK